jgi:hypothetical protein
MLFINREMASGLGLQLLLMTVIIPIAPASADVRFSGPCRPVLTGEITQADAEAISRNNCPPGTFTMVTLSDSPGGDVRAAMAIGRWLRGRNGIASVIQDCYSSCALVYIGGVRRMNGGEIGLHRPFLAGPPRPANEIQAAVTNMLANVGAYVAEMGVTPEFTNIMVNTPPETVRVFYQEEITSLVPEFDMVYDELRTAAWAKRRGLTTEEFRRRSAEAERRCFPLEDATEASDCMGATLWGLSGSVFKQRKSIATERCPDPEMALSREELAAWEARARQFDPHPEAVAHQRCVIAVMEGR